MPYDKKKIAELVKAGRTAKGYTQLELSELTRVSLRSIQRIENGDVEPRVYTLKVLAAQLDFEYSEAILPEEVIEQKSPEPLVKPVNRARLFILSIGAGILLLVFGMAFLSQTRRFPETTFEALSFWGGVILVYFVALWRIWK